jgi:hypothetical protein
MSAIESCRTAALGGFRYLGAVNNEQTLGRGEEPFSALFDCIVERCWKVLAAADVVDLQCHSQRRGHVLQRLYL